MSDPLYPGLQSNLVYGIETRVEETRMVDGACVVVSQHDTRRTYESPGAPLGAPAYTTVCDHVTSSYSGRQPYLVSAAANQNQSNCMPCMKTTPGFNNTTQTPMSYSYVQPNQAAQSQYIHFSPPFNSTAYSQNAYQPNQSFPPSQMYYNTTQYNQPTNQVDFCSQFTNSNTPNTFSFQPNQTFGRIENQICCPCFKELIDQISLNTTSNGFQAAQSSPASYNVFLVHQNHTQSNVEPMITNSNSDDNLGAHSCLCIQDGGQSRSTSTTDLTAGKRDPCTTSTPISSWPPEEGGTKDLKPAAAEGKPKETEASATKTEKPKETEAAATKTDESNKTETEKIIESKLDEANKTETATHEIITSILNDMLPHEDGNEGDRTEVSKAGVDNKCPCHHTSDKDTSTSGCKPRVSPHCANTAAGNNTDHRHGRPACGCAKAIKKVTFAVGEAIPGADVTRRMEAMSGADITRRMDFGEFETEMNNWYLELEEIERVFINQAEETIRRDAQNFKTRNELTSLAELLVAEIDLVEQIDRDLQSINSVREGIEAFTGQLENYYDAFQETSPPSPRKYVYGLFEVINSHMFEMRISLGETSELITERNGLNTQQKDPVRQIMKILGIHLETLNNIDKKVNCLRSGMDEISTLFNQFSWKHSR